jgi:hypothetical protein
VIVFDGASMIMLFVGLAGYYLTYRLGYYKGKSDMNARVEKLFFGPY